MCWNGGGGRGRGKTQKAITIYLPGVNCNRRILIKPTNSAKQLSNNSAECEASDNSDAIRL